MVIFPKDPSSNVDFSFDWADWLLEGETITEAGWIIVPNDSAAPTLSGATVTGDVTGVFVAGGRVGARYRLTCNVQTSDGRVADRSLVLRIMEQ